MGGRWRPLRADALLGLALGYFFDVSEIEPAFDLIVFLRRERAGQALAYSLSQLPMGGGILDIDPDSPRAIHSTSPPRFLPASSALFLQSPTRAVSR